MNIIIKRYGDYNERRFGTPWAAPCDSTGRPNFKGKTGRFTGGRGEGGDLFAEDPDEGSVWAYGQKDFRGGSTEKSYAQYRNGAFHHLEATELLAALSEVNRPTITNQRKDELLGLLFARVSLAEIKAAGITKQEAEAYNITWEE